MAKKDVNVVTSLVGKGLEREYLLLKDLLNAHDVYVNAYHYTNIAGSNYVRADITLFLEVVMPNALTLSRENWFFPNSEWHQPLNDRFLPQFTKILCKTKDCYRIWSDKIGAGRCEYIGFEARDLYRPEVIRENRFLHVAGESEFKNTEAVITAWKSANWSLKPPPLTVVTRQKRYQDLCTGCDVITCIPRATDDELAQLMNSHRFHIIPSAYEGFGHSIHESLMCGAFVITTDASPMNEFAGISEVKVPAVSKTTRSLAQLSGVTPWGVTVAACQALSFSGKPEELNRRQQATRLMALAERNDFRSKFLRLVGV